MPKVEITVKTKDGQTILLSPEDRIERAVTTECVSGRCESRHGKRQEVTVVDGVLPEGNQWMMLVVSEQSPSYQPQGIHLCSPQCVKDFLVYDYVAPGPRTVSEQTTLPEGTQVEYHTSQQPPVTLPPNSGAVLRVVEPTNQADGSSDPGDEHQ